MKTINVEFIEEVINVVNVIDFPEEVVEAFRLGEDNDTTKLWFALLENKICFRFIVCPQSKPKALASPILTFVRHEEIQEKLHSTACFYLQCALEKEEIIGIHALHRYFQYEYAVCMDELDECQNFSRKMIYANLLNWLLYNFENYDEMFKNLQLIKNFLNIALLSHSKILESQEFQDLFHERKVDFISIHGTK